MPAAKDARFAAEPAPRGSPRVFTRFSEPDFELLEVWAKSAGVSIYTLVREAAIRHGRQTARALSAGEPAPQPPAVRQEQPESAAADVGSGAPATSDCWATSEVPVSEAGALVDLDLWLVGRGVSRAYAYEAIRDGQVTIGGQVWRKARVLRAALEELPVAINGKRV